MWYVVGNVDYISTPTSIIFSAGETTALYNASTIIDNILEINETYILSIDINLDSMIKTSVNISTIDALVIIIDDDRK